MVSYLLSGRIPFIGPGARLNDNRNRQGTRTNDKLIHCSLFCLHDHLASASCSHPKQWGAARGLRWVRLTCCPAWAKGGVSLIGYLSSCHRHLHRYSLSPSGVRGKKPAFSSPPRGLALLRVPCDGADARPPCLRSSGICPGHSCRALRPSPEHFFWASCCCKDKGFCSLSRVRRSYERPSAGS
jgi:hypothetical protein